MFAILFAQAKSMKEAAIAMFDFSFGCTWAGTGLRVCLVLCNWAPLRARPLNVDVGRLMILVHDDVG